MEKEALSSDEEHLLDQKTFLAVTGKTTDWNEIAKTTGSRLLLLDIEDGQDAL